MIFLFFGFASPGGLASRLGKPALAKANARAALVFPRCSTSLRLPLTLAKAAPCLVSRLRKPRRSCFAAPGACTPGLRPGVCLPSHAAEPLCVSLLVAGPAAPSRLFTGEPPAPSRLGHAEPCRLARTFASPGGGLRGNSFCYSRKIVNPPPICHSREGGNPGVPY